MKWQNRFNFLLMYNMASLKNDYIAYQTGLARDKFYSGNFTPSKNTIGNTDIERRFLTHNEEAEGEMVDFKKKFGNLFETEALYKDYKVFLSIGSTSTQGWQINSEGNYEVIIPDPKLDTDTPNYFMQLGTKINDQPAIDNGTISLEGILSRLEIGPTRKVLCFNGIGYSFNKEYTGNGIELLTSKYIDNNKLINAFRTKLSNTDNIYICQRTKMFDVDDIKLQLGGSWASGLAIKEEKRVIDIGGGAVHIYEAKTGTKLTGKPLSVNDKEINPNTIYGDSFSDMAMADSVILSNIEIAVNNFEKSGSNSDLDKSDLDQSEFTLKNNDITLSIGGQKSKRRRSKRRKSKRKRSKRRHR